MSLMYGGKEKDVEGNPVLLCLVATHLHSPQNKSTLDSAPSSAGFLQNPLNLGRSASLTEQPSTLLMVLTLTILLLMSSKPILSSRTWEPGITRFRPSA